MNTDLMFSSARTETGRAAGSKDEWRTPQAFFEALDAEFGFDLDVAASEDNRWVENYFGPDHWNELRRDALALSWAAHGQVCWLNPPYSQNAAFIAKAAQEAQQGATVVCLVPARTDVRWFHQHAYDVTSGTFRPGVEVRFVKGRLKFGAETNSAPFPSMVLIFRSGGVNGHV